MKRILRFILTACLVIMAGCSQQLYPETTVTPGPTDTPGPTAAPTQAATEAPTPAPSATAPAPTALTGEGIDSSELLALLPEDTGFTWNYDGSMESGHEMTLQTVTESGGIKKYVITGTVRDVSGGESDRDLRIQITYTVDQNVWVQEKNAAEMLESSFDKMEILRAPLAVGQSWEQTAENELGDSVTLTCTLENITDSNGKSIYTVKYEDKNTGYYERREITDGVGITAFERLTTDTSGAATPIGYWLTTGGVPDRSANASAWLPPLGKTLSFTGASEYGYQGSLIMEQNNDQEIVYRFNGVYTAGEGSGGAFVVRYYYDKSRETFTEKAVSNEFTGEAQINSILHNVVLLRFPLHTGSTWVHDTMIGEERHSVTAEVVEYDNTAGRVKVRYTAEDVPGYYNNTYIEERVFEVGRGMVGFGQLMPGDISIGDDNPKPVQIQQAISNHMFGYSQEPEDEEASD